MYLAEPPWLGGGSCGSPSTSSCMTRAKPKSQIWRCRLSASRTRFEDFKSRWATVGRWLCKYRTPSRSWMANWKRSTSGKECLLTCRAWCRLPPGASSVTRAMCAGSKQAPANATTRGWLSSERILISAKRSLAACSLYMQSFWCIIFTTTSRCGLRNLPRLTMANSPRLTHFSKLTSLHGMTLSSGRRSLRSCSAAARSSGTAAAASAAATSGKSASSDAVRDELTLVGVAVEAVAARVETREPPQQLLPTGGGGLATVRSGERHQAAALALAEVGPATASASGEAAFSIGEPHAPQRGAASFSGEVAALIGEDQQ
mmetsp:Transcript_66582/g.210514  ORF Transcript_66582/g.210514 Transcript_66582/m.210514 type:complete len:317 (-) Transcript_66582:1917-2867(-)